MNFAILSKLGSPAKDIKQLVSILKNNIAHSNRRQDSHSVEVVFYLSAQNAQEFFMLSFWYILETSSTLAVESEILNRPNEPVHLLERHIFKLNWEYRLITQTPATSHIRLMTFPAGLNEQEIQPVINKVRTRRQEVPSIIGSWIGRDITNPNITLHRVDWLSVEDRQNFFNSEITQAEIARRKARGIKIEYASFELQGIVQFETESRLPQPNCSTA